MSVVGIDFGNLNSVIAVARNRGIDVICNEVSNRLTPTMVSFGPKARHIGEGAKTLEISNFKYTIANLKRLIGRKFDDQEILGIESKFLNCELVPDENGFVAVKVVSQGEEKIFSLVQLVAMFFSKLKEITQEALQSSSILDVVLSVPSYFTDHQRRSLLDAAEISGLNVLRLMNESTASALSYGIPKHDLSDDKPKYICFVDMGQSATTVSIVAFSKGRLEVKAVAFDRHLGGRNFDEALTTYYIKEFNTRYNININSSLKAVYRLRSACEKAKKILSANSKTIVSVESIMDDKDVSSEITRSHFEELTAHLLDQLDRPLLEALQFSSLKIEDLDAIELVGGSTRIPAVKEKISKIFNGRDLSNTLNQDEVISRGCAFQCAILSPTFKVKDFSVQDMSPYSISLIYEPTIEDPEDTSIQVFCEGNVTPCTKLVTFNRKQHFEMEAIYSSCEILPSKVYRMIGRYSITNINGKPNGPPLTIKVKVKLNPSGLLVIDQAQVVEDLEPEVNESEIVPEEGKTEETTSRKKKVKKTDLPVVSYTASLPRETIQNLRELEVHMAANDKLVSDTEERKNSLEEYIYDMRNKLSGELSDFATDALKDQLGNLLHSTEEWLYNDGWDSTKSTYIAKLEELKKLGQPIVELFKEFELRNSLEKIFRETCQTLISRLSSSDENYSHLPQEEKSNCIQQIKERTNWLNEQLDKQNKLPKHNNKPVIVSASIKDELSKLVNMTNSLLQRPKPTPKVERSAECCAKPHEISAENVCAGRNPHDTCTGEHVSESVPLGAANMEVD